MPFIIPELNAFTIMFIVVSRCAHPAPPQIHLRARHYDDARLCSLGCRVTTVLQVLVQILGCWALGRARSDCVDVTRTSICCILEVTFFGDTARDNFGAFDRAFITMFRVARNIVTA
jgi:hypothetical protein